VFISTGSIKGVASEQLTKALEDGIVEGEGEGEGEDGIDTWS
jgi:hypothetical protein